MQKGYEPKSLARNTEDCSICTQGYYNHGVVSACLPVNYPKGQMAVEATTNEADCKSCQAGQYPSGGVSVCRHAEYQLGFSISIGSSNPTEDCVPCSVGFLWIGKWLYVHQWLVFPDIHSHLKQQGTKIIFVVNALQVYFLVETNTNTKKCSAYLDLIVVLVLEMLYKIARHAIIDITQIQWVKCEKLYFSGIPASSCSPCECPLGWEANDAAANSTDCTLVVVWDVEILTSTHKYQNIDTVVTHLFWACFETCSIHIINTAGISTQFLLTIIIAESEVKMLIFKGGIVFILPNPAIALNKIN